MVFTFEQVNYQEIRRLVFISTKIIVGFLIVIYFGTSLVFCNEDIPFCNKRLTTLKVDVKVWQERCVNDEGQDVNTSCCKAEKEYNQKRMRTQTKLCFFKGNDAIRCDASWQRLMNLLFVHNRRGNLHAQLSE